MSIKYLCGACCTILNIESNRDAVNEAGRKYCSRCGINTDWKMHILSDKEYTAAMMAQGDRRAS